MRYTGHSAVYCSSRVSKPFFEGLLEAFAREAGAGLHRTIILVLDNAGWHGEAGLNVPEGVRLVFLRALYAGTATGRDAVGVGRRTARQQTHRHNRSVGGHRRKSMPRPRRLLAAVKIRA